MTKKFVNTGPLAGQIGLPPGKHWRCPACSLLCRFQKDQCPRCTEVVTEEEKNKYEVKASSVKSRHIPLHLAKPKKGEPQKPRSTKSRAPAGKTTKSKTTSTLNSNKKTQKKTKSVRGFNSKGKTKNVSLSKKPNKKAPKPIHKQDPKQLGYKPSRKGNVNTFTRSKLNHDTASYRGKFAHTAKPLGGKKMNIATIEHLVSKQGFNTAVKKMKNGCDSHTDRPVTPPGKRKKGGKRQSSWITALQQAASTGAVASLKHRDARHEARHLDIAGKKSKMAL